RSWRSDLGGKKMTRPRLSSKQFLRLARRAFGDVLEPAGFSCDASKFCTFYRRVAEDVYHFIRPVRSFRLPQYDLWVFPHSPKLERRFLEKFPEELGPPTDVWCKLDPTEGVGLSQAWYWCRTEQGFLRDFRERVGPAMTKHALPFLDRIRCYEDMVPLIR